MSVPSQKSRAPGARETKAPRRRRGKARVAALTGAGVAVFAEVGFDAATMTEIAARAGASIGSLYQFFPTKEHLAAEIHAAHLAELDAMLDGLAQDVAGRPAETAIELLFAGLVRFLNANPAFNTLGERRSLDPAVKKKARRQLRGRLTAMLGAVDPPIPPDRRPALAALVLYLIRVAAMLSGDDDPSIRDDALRELEAMLRTHMAAGRPTGS